MSATITYKGATIATAENETKTLKTAGKYLEGDVIITDATQGGMPKEFVMRPDAEMIHRWEADELVVADLGLTLPAYKTSAQTIKATRNLTPAISVDYDTYCYYVLMRGLSTPVYNQEAKVKGMCDYTACTYLHEVAVVHANEVHSMDGSKSFATRSAVAQTESIGRAVYWSSTSAIAVATANTYGTNITATAPAVSGTAITCKHPVYGIRGNTTQMTSGAWSHMTDIREQWCIEVWRAPNENLEGWELMNGIRSVLEDVRNGGKLK